jgi:phosphoribosyl 1,2-cyclic phosphate phosphodiesterase
MGVPVAGCDCRVCTSQSPLNRRLRPSILVQTGGKQLLIDCGPDFRQQALAHHIQRIDGLLLTHVHFDHIAGIDDLRIYCIRQNQAIDCLLSQESLDDLEKRYSYLMHKDDDSVARFRFDRLVQSSGKREFATVPLSYFTYAQPGAKVTGYRFGSFAYVTDIKEFTEDIVQELQGIETLILGAYKKSASRMHFTIDEGLAFCKKVRPKQCYFTHMGHEIDYFTLRKQLPPNIEPAFDGLTFSFH